MGTIIAAAERHACIADRTRRSASRCIEGLDEKAEIERIAERFGRYQHCSRLIGIDVSHGYL